jgi:hypothetical protein
MLDRQVWNNVILMMFRKLVNRIKANKRSEQTDDQTKKRSEQTDNPTNRPTEINKQANKYIIKKNISNKLMDRSELE